MKLKVLGPARTIMEQDTTRLMARGPDGYFAVLPRHTDFVSQLDPGPLVYHDNQGQKQSLELPAGLMVKCGVDVLVWVSALPAQAGAGEPRPDDREQQASAVVADLEAEFTRLYLPAKEVD